MSILLFFKTFRPISRSQYEIFALQARQIAHRLHPSQHPSQHFCLPCLICRCQCQCQCQWTWDYTSWIPWTNGWNLVEPGRKADPGRKDQRRAARRGKPGRKVSRRTKVTAFCERNSINNGNEGCLSGAWVIFVFKTMAMMKMRHHLHHLRRTTGFSTTRYTCSGCIWIRCKQHRQGWTLSMCAFHRDHSGWLKSQSSKLCIIIIPNYIATAPPIRLYSTTKPSLCLRLKWRTILKLANLCCR